MDYDALLAAVARMGALLIQYGAEIYRAEESMHLLFAAYGAKEQQVFALLTCVNVTLCKPDGAPLTAIRRVEDRCIDLEKVHALNDLCRRACARRMPLVEMCGEMDAIARNRGNAKPLRALGYAGVGFGFTLFFGGGALDALVSAMSGLAVYWLQMMFQRYRANAFFATLLQSAAIGCICLLAAQLFVGMHVDKMIIGSVMILVPGLAITSFMRDILSGDYLSGVTRFVESMLIATAIALGIGAMMVLSRLVWGV